MSAATEMQKLNSVQGVDDALLAEELLNEIEQGVFPSASELLAAEDADLSLDGLIESQDDLLDDLDAALTVEAQVASPTPLTADDLLGATSVIEDNGIDKDALYEEQESSTTVASEEDAKEVTHENKPGHVEGKGRKTRTPSTAGAGSVTRAKKVADVEGLSKLGMTDDETKSILAKIDEAPKKVAEKANNLIRYALGREHISNFTRFTLLKLREKPQGFTVPELVNMLTSERSYSIGTARSQAQQQSRLFMMFGMASKDGKSLVLNGDNVISKAVIARLTGDAHIDEPADNDSTETVATAA